MVQSPQEKEKRMGKEESEDPANSMVIVSKPEPLAVSGVEHWTRRGISAASMASNIGFAAATMGTKLGFAIARGATTMAITTTATVLDYTVLGGVASATGPLVNSAVITGLNLAEQLALAPIQLGQSLASTSLIAASESIDVLQDMFGTHEASFSLRAFVGLVRREWETPVMKEYLPLERPPLYKIARAIVAWSSLQSATRSWHEKRWMGAVKEIDDEEWMAMRLTSVAKGKGRSSPTTEAPPEPLPLPATGVRGRSRSDTVSSLRDSRVFVKEDVLLPDAEGQIISADIGAIPADPSIQPPPPPSNNLRLTLRRFSRMVLGGYGGAGLLFFGVPFPSKVPSNPTSPAASTILTSSVTSSDMSASAADKREEEEVLAQVIQDAEADEEAQELHSAPPRTTEDQVPVSRTEGGHTWWEKWNIVRGERDQEIFEGFAFLEPEELLGSKKKSKKGDKKRKRKSTAELGTDQRIPRYWVLTDHGRKQIVLVFRGTMSLNELAVDLACDPEEFQPARAEDAPPPTEKYIVHGGMLRMARAMGAQGRPVHDAVSAALRRNRRYELILCGHSLGAGVAALLAMMWADPSTCLTVPSSSLPAGRRVSAYCFAPPCLTSPALSRLASNLITSFVYSHDIVSRLSLGSIRDMTHAALWLCEGRGEERPSAVLRRSLAARRVFGRSNDQEMDEAWLLSFRKTLEANMHMSDLFPTGRVLWAIRSADIDMEGEMVNPDKLRIFEVLRVEDVFDQIVFARDMLSAHAPHNYDRVLHDLLL